MQIENSSDRLFHDAAADLHGRGRKPAFIPQVDGDRMRRAQRLRSCFSAPSPRLGDFDASWFSNLCLAARNLEDVHDILRMVHAGLGSKACVLAQIGPTRFLSSFQLLVDVPDALATAIVSRPMADDAVMTACKQRVLGFAWSDLERIIQMNERRRETLAIYASYGMHEGFTVPLSVPGEPRGFCSFAWEDPRDATLDVMAIIVLAAQCMFETARRVLGLWVERRERLELTPRQIDCLAGVACGLNDAQIAHELGISVETVHDHLEVARKRYGAHKRTDLMVKAIRSGELPWSRITGSRSAWASARYRAGRIPMIPRVDPASLVAS